MKLNPRKIKKAITATVGFVLTVLATALTVGPEVIPKAYLPYIHIGIAVGTIYGVYQVRNADQFAKGGSVRVKLSDGDDPREGLPTR